VDGLSSRIIHIIFSVPQGSVLGPLLFILYTAVLADIAAQYEITLHAFADDNQLYVHCVPQPGLFDMALKNLGFFRFLKKT